MTASGDQARGGRKVLIACLGNPDRGDDGAGAMVARALAGRLPEDVALVVRGGDMLGLIEDWAGFDALVCVDAAAAAGVPGRIHRIDLANETLPAAMSVTSGHAFGLAEAVQLARTLRRAPVEIIVYAIEGGTFEAGAPVTVEVATAAGEVARRVIAEVDRLRQSEPTSTAPA